MDSHFRLRAATVFLLFSCSCSSSASDPASETDRASADVVVEQDKTAVVNPKTSSRNEPSKTEASKTLLRFSEQFGAGDLSGATHDLRVPDGFNKIQVNTFLKDLAKPGHLSSEGVAAIIDAEFGTLSQRFGERAPALAAYHKLKLEEAYAFGDDKAAAILHWDGQRFRVAAVHRLGGVGEN